MPLINGQKMAWYVGPTPRRDVFLACAAFIKTFTKLLRDPKLTCHVLSYLASPAFAAIAPRNAHMLLNDLWFRFESQDDR